MLNGKGKEVEGTTEIISCNPTKTFQYIIGRSSDCDYTIIDNELREKHIKIMYSPQSGWNAVDVKTAQDQNSQTGVLIKTYKRYLNKEPSTNFLLINGMTIGVLGTGIKICIQR